MGLFSPKKTEVNVRDQADSKWSVKYGSGKRDRGGRDVEQERRAQNPNGFRRSGKW